jgi:hypothetical protein
MLQIDRLLEIDRRQWFDNDFSLSTNRINHVSRTKSLPKTSPKIVRIKFNNKIIQNVY